MRRLILYGEEWLRVIKSAGSRFLSFFVEDFEEFFAKV